MSVKQIFIEWMSQILLNFLFHSVLLWDNSWLMAEKKIDEQNGSKPSLIKGKQMKALSITEECFK